MSYLQNRKMNGGDWLNYSLIVLMSLVCVFPLLYVFSVSFTDPDAYRAFEFSLWPAKWSLSAYKYILSTSSFMDSFKATAFVTVIGTALNLFVTYTFAYGLTRKALPGRGAFLGVVFFTLIFNAGIVPNYLMMKWLGLLNTLWSLILFGLTNSWSIIVVKSFLQTLPVELEEAAIIDGCSRFGTFLRIGLPLTRTGMIAVGTMTAINTWKEFLFASIIINKGRMRPVAVVIFDLIGEMGLAFTEMGLFMTACMLVMVPLIVTFLFVQRLIVEGLTAGSVKS